MVEETTLENSEANSYLTDKRYWWFLGHGVAIDDEDPEFAGICTDKPWSWSCDLYGPSQMANG